jgi:hypothetical protein
VIERHIRSTSETLRLLDAEDDNRRVLAVLGRSSARGG